MSRINRNPPASTGSVGSGLFRRTYEATLGARQSQARPYAAYFLLGLDDAALEQLGYDRRLLEQHGASRDPF